MWTNGLRKQQRMLGDSKPIQFATLNKPEGSLSIPAGAFWFILGMTHSFAY